MVTRRPDAGALSVRRAFVVHFASLGGRRRRFIGRAEHLSSGRVTQFFSLAELLRFIELAPIEAEAPGGATSSPPRASRPRSKTSADRG